MPTQPALPPTICIRLRNSTGRDLDLWIEPLGDHILFPKHTAIEVRCNEQLGHPNEIEWSDNAISIHGWVQNVSALDGEGGLRLLWSLPI